ncbi:glycosyltransferase [Shewanella baltica]|uniref:glycosyltransferase n=1 Tax=Shewanella baltica TaxID=62322 RepID=UPI00217D3524|nr:glycosyltransferase [Shewanella baltica]MCS6209211.1 glycosyltransferase [Shewanella baltica]
MYNDILIVVVVYNRSIENVKIISKVLNSHFGIELYIYDNSLVPDVSFSTEVADRQCRYISDPSNSGVSKAYNLAFEYAISKDKHYVLILDQDSQFELAFLERYFDAVQQYGVSFIYSPLVCDAAKTKIYSPAKLNNFVGHSEVYEKKLAPVIVDISNRSVINSGLMIPVSIFSKIGGYNNKIKLDFSDVYFIEIYKIFNKSVVLVDVELLHSLSGDEGPKFLTEMKRFPYYCIGALELTKSLNKSTLWTVLRRTVRLVIKYRNFSPILLFFKYYVKGENI